MSRSDHGRGSDVGRWDEGLIAAAVVALASYAAWTCRELANDDAFITYRYALNLAAGHGFVYNPGERVLGTTTPLYTLLLAGFAVLGASLPLVSNVIGCLSVGAQAWAARRILRWLGAGAGVSAAAAIALVGGGLGSYWHVGMETLLLAALLCWSVVMLLERRLLPAALLAALACLTRPDSVLLLGLLAVSACLRWRSQPRALLRAGALVALLGGGWLVFSWSYFGSLLPTSLAAKQGAVSFGPAFSATFVELGSAVLGFARDASPFTRSLRPEPTAVVSAIAIHALAALGLAAAWRRHGADALFLLYPWVFLAFYVAVRPPPGHGWHLYPAQLLLALAATFGAASLVRRHGAAFAGPRLATMTCVGLAVAGSVYLGRLPADFERDVWYGQRSAQLRQMGRLVARHVPPMAAVSALEIGLIGYEAPNPLIDRAGLITPDLGFHSTRRRVSLQDALRRHPTDYVVVMNDEPAEVAAEYRTIAVAADSTYAPLILLRRRGGLER